jgi:hypothetical protein
MVEQSKTPQATVFEQADQELTRLARRAADTADAADAAERRDGDQAPRLSHRGFREAALRHARHGENVLDEIRRRMSEQPALWDHAAAYIGQVADQVRVRAYRSVAREGWAPRPFGVSLEVAHQQAQQVEGGNVWSLVVLALDDLGARHPECFGDLDTVEKHAYEIRARLERAEESLDILARAGARHLVGACVMLGLAADSRDSLVLARRLRDHVRIFGETPAPPPRPRGELGAFLR